MRAEGGIRRGERGRKGEGEDLDLDHNVLDHTREIDPAEAHEGKALATILPDQEKQRELCSKLFAWRNTLRVRDMIAIFGQNLHPQFGRDGP